MVEYGLWNGPFGSAQGRQRDEYYRGAGAQLLTLRHFPAGTEGQSYWYHLDGRGSVSGLTKQQGQSTHNYRYDAYGQLLPAHGNFTDPHNHYTFSGKEWDEHLDSYEFGYRQYDPAAGVWLTQDPLRGEPSRPRTLHRYQYVFASPISYRDPYGLAATPGDVGGGGPWPPTPTPSTPTPSAPTGATDSDCLDYGRFDKALAFIYQEMITNAQSEKVTNIKFYLDAIENPQWYHYLDQEYPNNYWIAALTIWTVQVHSGGPWDHKPILAEMLNLPGDANTSLDDDYYFPIRGDTEHEYFYDLWSNIHYGYVGFAAGFDVDTLQQGAAGGDFLVGTNDEFDVLNVQIGIELWNEHGLELTPELLHQAILSHKEDYLRLQEENPNSNFIVPIVNGR